MRSVHVAVGTSQDLPAFHEYLKKFNIIKWPVPKQAKVGDQVLFLIPFMVGSIHASGTVLGDTFASGRWSGKYEAVVGIITVLKNPVPIETLRACIPEWKYLNYAKSYTTVPAQHVNALEKILNEKAMSSEGSLFPDEVTIPLVLREGVVRQVLVNAYERNSAARTKCLEHHGKSCSVCGFNFREAIGDLGEGVIHVHHLRPLSDIGEEYKVDPVKDLRPVCPNCHAIIHLRTPPFTIQEAKELLNRTNK